MSRFRQRPGAEEFRHESVAAVGKKGRVSELMSKLGSLPVIIHGLKGGIADFRGGSKVASENALPRTDRDISMKWVVGGILALVVAITFLPALKMNILGAILIIIFGFLFVTVSSRLTGEI